MKLIALDTSGDACSASLYSDGSVLQALEHAPRRHGELILGMMQALLDEAGLRLHDMDALAFGRGPGSFTGVRIAASVAQGAAFAADLPVVPVSTLAAMAQGEFRRSGRRRLLTALDARMDEVYWGCYEVGEDDLARPSDEEIVCPPETLPVPEGSGWTGVGPAWAAYSESMRARVGSALQGVNPEAICEARDIVLLALSALDAGLALAPEQAIPVYLRDKVTRVG